MTSLISLQNIEPTDSSVEPVTVYCDVDGVLNSYRKQQAYKRSRVNRKLPLIGGLFPPLPVIFNWNPVLMRAFTNVLTATPGVTLTWLTTWNGDAETLLGGPLLRLTNQQVLPYHMRVWETFTHKNKYKLLREHQEQNPTRFVWIDDVATRQFNEKEWTNHPGQLLIPTDAWKGITMEQVGLIEKFIARVD